MSNLHRRHARLSEAEPTDEPIRSPFSHVASRFASWIAGADRMPPDDEPFDDLLDEDSLQPLTPLADRRLGQRGEHQAEPLADRGSGSLAEELHAPVAEEPTRFPLVRLGYERAAVDRQLLELESELVRLRAERSRAPMSVAEELERLGEQTASILVVAHDKAQETTRRAQEQADRCVADAAANAVEITAKAKDRLRQLDSETDSVWRERERLLDDVRVVSLALATLADEASARFPAAELPAGQRAERDEPEQVQAPVEQATVAFTAIEAVQALVAEDAEAADAEPERVEDSAGVAEPARAGDTGSWLAGLKPE
ncbi:MAG: DivIVA domain-containing protein [Solirubrobacteraceae bacterium]